MYGDFRSFALGGVDFALPRKCVVKLINPGKTKGTAAVRLVLGVLRGSTNGVLTFNGSGIIDRGRVGRSVNVIFSDVFCISD